MHFKSVVVLFSFLLPVVVRSAPFVNEAPVQLYARAVTVVVEADPNGDYKNLLHKPAHPDALPPGCSTADKKKAGNKCKSWDALHQEFMNTVTPRVTAAIEAAESVLHATGTIHALVKSVYHYSAAHDDLHHWTFSFSAPGCGPGPCVGHAYEAGKTRSGRIFDSTHHIIFGA